MKNKVTIGGVAAIVLLVYVYLAYFSGGSAPLTVGSAGDVSGDLLVTLNSLHTIRLDNTIFTDPTFVSLSDFGVSIPPQQAGRGNPFAPLGQGGSATTTKR